MRIPDNFDEKVAALETIGEVEFRYFVEDSYVRSNGGKPWSVFIRGVYVGGDGFEESLSGKGDNPFEAVFNVWERIAKLKVLSKKDDEKRYLRIDDRKVYWADFMWKDFPSALLDTT